MSSFHTITVTMPTHARPKNFAKLIREIGGLHRTGKMADTYAACARLSKHPGISHVTLTRVHEAPAGVWRDGKQST